MISDLVRGLFDYAGLFPPAELAWEEMVVEARGHPASLRWPLVGNDLVVTPDHLNHLGDIDWDATACLVGVTPDTAGGLAEQVATQDHVRFTSIEVHYEGAAPSFDLDVPVYLEPRDEPDWERLARHCREHGHGIKFRAAGPYERDTRDMADILAAVAAYPVPVKATQGLHHPFVDDPKYDNDHGFLNLVVALRLAQEGAEQDEILACLRDSEEAHFDFDHGVAWNGRRLSMQRVMEHATKAPIAVGSCSLHEPDQDLTRLFGR